MKISNTVLTILLTSSTFFSRAQDLDKAIVKGMVDSGKFVFVAQSMLPSGGASRQIDSYYDVKISKDSLVTYLPYFGRAYTGVVPGETGVNFTSTSFDYSAKLKKNKWEISVRPQDSKNVRELQFTVFENGRATLLVNPVNKQAINYYGYLKEE